MVEAPQEDQGFEGGCSYPSVEGIMSLVFLLWLGVADLHSVPALPLTLTPKPLIHLQVKFHALQLDIGTECVPACPS